MQLLKPNEKYYNNKYYWKAIDKIKKFFLYFLVVFYVLFIVVYIKKEFFDYDKIYKKAGKIYSIEFKTQQVGKNPPIQMMYLQVDSLGKRYFIHYISASPNYKKIKNSLKVNDNVEFYFDDRHYLKGILKDTTSLLKTNRNPLLVFAG